MSSTRFREAYDQMIHDNQALFDRFQIIHDAFALNENENRDEFNEVGKEVMNIVRKYEDILCRRSEETGHGGYTTALAEKFQNEVRKNFPKVDSIGIRKLIMKPIESKPSSNAFNLRKIGLR
jgi:hypothetical protein